MSDPAFVDDITRRVLAQMMPAKQALRNQDIEGVIQSLDAAVAIHEQHPRALQEPTSLMADILVAIRATRSVCGSLGMPDDQLRALDERAEALRASRLH